MRTETGRRAAAVTLAAAIALAGCADGDEPAARRTTTAPAPPAAGDRTATDLQETYEEVVRTVLPSVVQIETDKGEGSGVVYDDAGHIVTNAHVVAGAKKIQVVPASGGAPMAATLAGAFDPDDLAVVKVEGGRLPKAAFGDSTRLAVGQMVLAMGNPLGLSGSVTNGIISAMGRTVSTRPGGAFPGSTISQAIQTSAAINPGNSGGALVTLDGKVIGIPTAAAGSPSGGAAPGIGFATPSATVTAIVPQLIQDGKVTNSGRAALGVTVRTVVNLSNGRPVGAEVVKVEKEGGALKAGIQPGDVITALNGTETPTTQALTQVLAALKPGDAAEVTVMRGGERRTLDVTLGRLPAG
ncbi:S1C family serine protease [Spirillospora albida]|uniref:S1C family serine protease n=1 Tax=Spirillospora albida TaxID=58123 RepID=UPI00056488C3|nr:trypsin-like peptidase domain-containing protein [Spirillospora albida]